MLTHTELLGFRTVFSKAPGNKLMSQLDNQTFFFLNSTKGTLGNNITHSFYLQRGCYAKGALGVTGSLAKGQQSSPPSRGLRLLASCVWPFLVLWNHNEAPQFFPLIAAN